MITNLDEYYKDEIDKSWFDEMQDDGMNKLNSLRPIKYMGQDLRNSNVDLIEENFINLEENSLSDYLISISFIYFRLVLYPENKDIKLIHKGEDGKFYIINREQYLRLFVETVIFECEMKKRRDEHKDDKTE